MFCEISPGPEADRIDFETWRLVEFAPCRRVEELKICQL